MRRSLALSMFLGLGLLGTSLTGCLTAQDPVNRVQPMALAKSYFVGEDLQGAADDPEFWSQGTLVDVGYGASQDGLFTSTYAQPVSRVRWQITERMLFARLAYERIQGTDGNGVGGPVENGVVVAAYPILSHFDIRRQYNSTTGEEANVIEENTTDRPWYQRQFMRVDWSQNLNTDSYDFDTLSMIGVYGGVSYEPLAYDITDPADPNAPVFALEDGYFDVTNKAFARPGMVDLSSLGWGIDEFPACFLDADFSGGTAPTGSCNPVELTIRQSFRLVEDHDYEPRDWDGFRFQAFGAFYTDRYGYARNYGMSDALWRRFINQPQIWERAHFYTDPENLSGAIECFTPTTTPFGSDPHRDADSNGTDDECEAAGEGSHCDTFKQRCTLPFADRTPQTIAWYYAGGSDPLYFDSTAEAAHQWDLSLRTAVRSAQYAECRNTGGEEGDCLTRFPMFFGQMDDYQDALYLTTEVDACRHDKGSDCNGLADRLASERNMDPAIASIAKMEEMIVLCHSPVAADDHEACGTARLPSDVSSEECTAAYAAASADAGLLNTCRAARNVRRGDLRYNQVNVLPAPQTPSPWGIMVDSIDPLSGETIATSINVWSHINDIFSQGAVDKLRFIAGEYQASDVTNGDYVRDWASAARAASGAGALPMLHRQDIDDRIAEFAGGEANIDMQNVAPQLTAEIRSLNHELRNTRAAVDAPSSNQAIYSARRQQAMGTEFEAQLMTPMVQQLNGVDSLPLNDAVMNMASPLRGGNPGVQRQINQLREEALGRRGACVMHPEEAEAPFSLVGLSQVMQEKFGAFNPDDSPEVQQARAEHMRRYVAQRAHMSVIAHEMGHSIGLRHNFVSSSDAWDYRPQYWQLRTENGATTTACTDLATDGTTCVGPRYFDPVTDGERDNLIWMWMQSTVMDYAGEMTQDMIGLGIYDYAATRMMYGDTVAVAADVTANQPYGGMLTDLQDNFGGILGITYTLGDNDIHYSQLQSQVGLIDNCETVADPLVFKPANWDEELNGVWSPLLDGQMVQVNGAWTRCRQDRVDYVPWRALSGTAAPSVDAANRPRMPYGFATDRWADLGNVSVYRHDNGADPYEIFNFLVTSQEVWHIFDSYRRGRQDFSVRNASERTLGRYNMKLRDGAKGLGLYRNIYRRFALERGYDFDTFWRVAVSFFPDNVLASGLAFDHFTRTLARPEAGPHFQETFQSDVLRSAADTTSEAGATLVTIPTGVSGYDGLLGMGGALVENQLCSNCGEYDSDYTMNAGSYYDKLNTAMLLTESVDNFISSSRTDFVDPRYRAVSLADLFPDGYRRWLANNLTNDDFIKGERVAASATGRPLRDAEGYPSQPIGFTSWWGETPQSCFPAVGTNICSSLALEDPTALNPLFPENTRVLDPQVGWEQQKFLIAWTMLYLFENEETDWLELMRVWEMGRDADPGFAQRIELHHPNGAVYIARHYGTEEIFGRTVQRGIGGRVLEYANSLLARAYETTDGPDVDGNGTPDWYLPVYSATTGLPIVRWDSTVAIIDDAGLIQTGGVPGCNASSSENCTCTSNRACVELQHYMSLPSYLREAVSAYHLGAPDARGVF
jgi:hypothetical protein